MPHRPLRPRPAAFSATFLLVAAAIVQGGAANAAEPDLVTPQEWRVLLIVRPKGELSPDGFPEVKYEMSRTDVSAAKVAFAESTTDFVKTLSRGRLAWKPEVVVSTTPLRKTAKLGGGNWVTPDCVADDIRRHAPPGKYDGVFVYWKDSDDKTGRAVKGGFGWTGAMSEAAASGYSCVNFQPADRLGRDSEYTEVFLHEWLHQLESFYGAAGVKLPRGGLHGDGNYGFKSQNGWKHWYEAFLNADLREGDGSRVGLGEDAWRRGTIRAEAVLRAPEFLTPERRRANPIADGSFERGDAERWASRSWLGNGHASAVVRDVSKEGKASLLIQSAALDDAGHYQKLAVKPGTRYLLSGWIRTENVAVEKGGSTGATLSVAGGYDSSRSLVGTNNWTYATLLFNSGDRKELEVGGRMGHHGSLASGKAWFDDLAVIAVP